MATINTNMSANIAANSMVRNDRTMTSTMERLSTGLRINSAKDDAAGLAISSKMTSQIRGLDQAVRNANDAISMIQVAEGAMKEVTNMFQRMRELAVQAISDSNTNADRAALNNEFKQLSYEVSRIGENTQWNGTNILDGARTNSVFQIGANASQTIAVNFGDLSAGNNVAVSAVEAHAGSTTAHAHITLTGDVSEGDTISFKTDKVSAGGVDSGIYLSHKLTAVEATAINAGTADATVGAAFAGATALGDNLALTVDSAGKIKLAAVTDTAGHTFSVSDVVVSRGLHKTLAVEDITTRTTAADALGVLDTAIENVNSTRATLGASMSRLEYAADNLQNVSQNSSAARSRVLDADYASETTELARTQIIQQASTAMLSQANQAQQSVLALLK
jgi:flagellin